MPPPCPPHIWRQIAPIVPAVRRVERQSTADGVPPAEIDAEQVGREHLRDTVGELLHSSELISDAVAEGRLAIVGANYRLAEGHRRARRHRRRGSRRRLTRHARQDGGTTT